MLMPIIDDSDWTRPLPALGRLRAVRATGTHLLLATKHFPSRGQSAVQELYQTRQGKLFFKQVSERNHRECQIDPATGSMAEREAWAFALARHLALPVPTLRLLDPMTTVQRWIDLPDAHLFKTTTGRLELQPDNVMDCALFDWLSGQVDRHDANYLYDIEQRRIILIDSGHAFLQHSGGLPDYLSLYENAPTRPLSTPVASPLVTAMRRLTTKTLERLVPLRDPREAAALEARLTELRRARSLGDIIRLYRSPP